jgi:hypothetical protein
VALPVSTIGRYSFPRYTVAKLLNRKGKTIRCYYLGVDPNSCHTEEVQKVYLSNKESSYILSSKSSSVLLSAHCHHQTFMASTMEDSSKDRRKGVNSAGMTIMCKHQSNQGEDGAII